MKKEYRAIGKGDIEVDYCRDCGQGVVECGWGAANCNNPSVATGLINMLNAQMALAEQQADENYRSD